MPLNYNGQDISFSALINEYNHARDVLNNRLQTNKIASSKALVIASERFLAGIIAKIQNGTDHQRSWILANRDQINAGMQQLAVIRQQLGMGQSPLVLIPLAPPEPNLHENEDDENNGINPRATPGWRALENLLFFGGLATYTVGMGQVMSGGYQALTGGYALFKATEEVGKKAAEVVITTGMAQIGTGTLTAGVGQVLMQVPTPGVGIG
jgi:hypothetical protein